MAEGVITLDFICKCWKENSYPDGFDDLLEKYIELKNHIFSDSAVNISEVTSWLKNVLIAIEIGILRDPARFQSYKDYWEKLLGRKWVASIEDRWVVWAD